MKILYDCFSCSPYYGSDELIGWIWPYYMRQYHEVWAVVRSDRREGIERYCRENHITDIHFIYADIPDWMNIYYKNLKKGKNRTLDFLLYQLLWQSASYRAAKKIHRNVHFDLVHKVGTNDFRILGQMYRLHIPYIIGPVGGAQETPEALDYYVRDHRKMEKLRTGLNRIMTMLPGYRKALNQADRVYFSNRETMDYLSSEIDNRDKCGILTEVGWNGDLPSLAGKTGESKVFTFLWAGRMEYRKGLEFLFDVLDQVHSDKPWQLILCGDGGERERYQQRAGKSAYADRVKFAGKVPYEEMQQIYDRADVFLFPSLRETTGTVIIEAMAHGVPVAALRQGGAVEVISDPCGFLIDGPTREAMTAKFAETIEFCLENPAMAAKMGENARRRIQEKYSWKTKAEEMSREYIRIAGK